MQHPPSWQERGLVLGPHVWPFCSKQGSSGCWGHPQAARHPSASMHLFFVTLGANSRADFPTGLADLRTRIAWLRNKVLVYTKYTHKIKTYQCLQIACSLSVGSSGVDVFNKHKYAEMLVRPFPPLILVSWCLQHVNRKEEEGFSSSSFLPLLNLKHQNPFSSTLLACAGEVLTPLRPREAGVCHRAWISPQKFLFLIAFSMAQFPCFSSHLQPRAPYVANLFPALSRGTKLRVSVYRKAGR